jgi:hypothetical protein
VIHKQKESQALEESLEDAEGEGGGFHYGVVFGGHFFVLVFYSRG